MYLGWSAVEEAQLGGAFLRECVTQETLKALVDAASEIDVTEFVPQVGTPTLVLCRREGIGGLEPARLLASGIPDARLVVLEGQSSITYIGDSEAVLSAIDEFLGEGEDATAGAEGLSEPSPTASVMPRRGSCSVSTSAWCGRR
jgi:pimeloyl-ACP methyl ester carboxylesterase